MRILLDTHFVIWMATKPSELTPRERAAIAQGSALVVSAISIWEIRIKWHATGRRQGPISPDAALRYLKNGRIDVADLRADDCSAILSTRPTHADPFDEMLLVHAQRLGARLLTRDGKLLAHPLAFQA